jgi:hypothetical protein
MFIVGKPVDIVWTKLAATANAGLSVIKVKFICQLSCFFETTFNSKHKFRLPFEPIKIFNF